MGRPARPASYAERLSRRRRNARRVLAAFVAFVAVDSFLVSVMTSREIRSYAMAALYIPGDRVLIFLLPYGIRTIAGRIPGPMEPVRGDVVLVSKEAVPDASIFSRVAERIVRFFSLQRVGFGDLAGTPGTDAGEGMSILRVIGTPGDTIRGQEGMFRIRPAGATMEISEHDLIPELKDTVSSLPPEGWIRGVPGSGDTGSVSLGKDEFYLAGDDRTHSIDSRHLGAFPGSNIEGRVILRYWPLFRPESP